MKIIRASVLGFCFGVRRAVELAEKALMENSGKKVYSLGPLIHNEKFLEKLNSKGLEIIEENQIDSLEEGAVVIVRAHGVGPNVIRQLEQKKCCILDATCPRVKASQKMVERYTNQNDYVILSGDKNHGEVIGIAGYAGKNFIQIQNKEEAENLDFSEIEGINAILMSQTTYSEKEFEQIESILRKKIKNIDVMNTICPATRERQEALVELCKKVDGVLVVGGKNSANTKRLFQTAAANCKNAALIQTADEIPQDFYKMETVGITAGASTPDEIIEAVEKSLCIYYNN